MKYLKNILYIFIILILFFIFHFMYWFFIHIANKLIINKNDFMMYLYLTIAYILGFIPSFGIGLIIYHTVKENKKYLAYILIILLILLLCFDIFDYLDGNSLYVFNNGIIGEFLYPCINRNKWYYIFIPVLRIITITSPLFLGMIYGENKYK